MAPTKKDGEKDHSASSKAVTREYTIDIHKHTRGAGFKKCAPCTLKEIQKFAMKEMGTSALSIDPSQRNKECPYCTCGWCPENIMRMKIHQTSLVPCVPVTTFKNLQSMWMRITH